HQPQVVEPPRHRLIGDAEVQSQRRTERERLAHLGLRHEKLSGEDVCLSLDRLRRWIQANVAGSAVARGRGPFQTLTDPMTKFMPKREATPLAGLQRVQADATLRWNKHSRHVEVSIFDDEAA